MQNKTIDQQDLKQKLNHETAVIEWRELEVFFARGQLIFVDQRIDLIDAACEVTLDNKSMIEKWLENNSLFLIDIDWVKQHCQADRLFWAVVVSPFVLIQFK